MTRRWDPAVVKVDERKKLYNYPKTLLMPATYWWPPGEKKESMEIVTTAFASKKMQHILTRKSEETQNLFPGSDIFCLLDCAEAKAFFGVHPRKNGACTLSFPYIFMAGVQLYVFTLSRLDTNYHKTRVIPSLPSGVDGRNIHSC